MAKEVTSRRVAAVASKALKSKRSSRTTMTLAASALTQREKKRKRQIAGWAVLCKSTIDQRWHILSTWNVEVLARAACTRTPGYKVVPVYA